MVLHSDSDLGAAAALVVLLAGVLMLLVSAERLASGKFRDARRHLLALGVLVGGYTLAVIAVSLLTPQRIVRVGDSYCVDLWCIGIQRVTPKPAGQEIVYKIDVRIFSDAHRVTTSATGVQLYLMDDRGRRFPLRYDPSVIPYDTTLAPGQWINTSLTFVTNADARQLFLTGDTPQDPSFWVKLYFGSDDSILHKRTLLRVV